MSIISEMGLSSLGDWAFPLVDELYMVDLTRVDQAQTEAFVHAMDIARALVPKAQQAALEELATSGVVELIAEISSTRPGAMPPDLADLARLYRWVRQHKPEVVLELGSGWSTYILAHALEQNGTGYIYSIDGEPQWTESNAAAVPPRLRHRCEIRYCQPYLSVYRHQPVVRHRDLPDCDPDLIYLDGPGVYPSCNPTADVIFLEPDLSRGTTIVVDGRHDSVIFLSDALSRSWSIQSQGIRCVAPNNQLKDLLALASVFELQA